MKSQDVAKISRPPMLWIAFASLGMTTMSMLTAVSWTSLGGEERWFHSQYVRWAMLFLFILAWGLHVIEVIPCDKLLFHRH